MRLALTLVLFALLPLGGCMTGDNKSAVDQKFVEAEQGGEAIVGNGNKDNLNIKVVSWRDIPFQTVKRQALDYSCGSATVATLVNYIYGQKTSEKEVFKAMFDKGDRAKIRQEGFSMLDMANYLNDKGYKANGFKFTLDMAEKNQVPFIALINNEGYNHFVVVKSVRGARVLVGDPNKGNIVYARNHFNKVWNGIALVVTNNAKKARYAFNNPKEWKTVRASARLSEGKNPVDDRALEPINLQIFPTSVDILTVTSNAVSSVNQGAISGAGGVP